MWGKVIERCWAESRVGMKGGWRNWRRACQDTAVGNGQCPYIVNHSALNLLARLYFESEAATEAHLTACCACVRAYGPTIYLIPLATVSGTPSQTALTSTS